MPPPSFEIKISRSEGTLILTEKSRNLSKILLKASIVSGCSDSGTPAGTYAGGKWIKDKTNPIHGPKPWSSDSWGNPYGPYFLPLNDAKNGRYTTYGIHGTRGPLIGNLERPPIPQKVVGLFFGSEEAKYLYCSHGCIRLSNQNITQLFKITTSASYANTPISIIIL